MDPAPTEATLPKRKIKRRRSRKRSRREHARIAPPASVAPAQATKVAARHGAVALERKPGPDEVCFSTIVQLRHAAWVNQMAREFKTTPGDVIQQAIRRYASEWKSRQPGSGTVTAADFKAGIEPDNAPPDVA